MKKNIIRELCKEKKRMESKLKGWRCSRISFFFQKKNWVYRTIIGPSINCQYFGNNSSRKLRSRLAFWLINLWGDDSHLLYFFWFNGRAGVCYTAATKIWGCLVYTKTTCGTTSYRPRVISYTKEVANLLFFPFTWFFLNIFRTLSRAMLRQGTAIRD